MAALTADGGGGKGGSVGGGSGNGVAANEGVGVGWAEEPRSRVIQGFQ